MPNFITVATFTYPQEAYVIKSRLENEGIYVFLKNELTIQTDNFLSNAMGGVQLQIEEKDLELALPILEKFGLIPENSRTEEVSRIQRALEKIPLVRRVPAELRIFSIVAFLLLLTTVAFVSISYPSKDERMEHRKAQEKEEAEYLLNFHHSYIIDSLIYNDPGLATFYIRDLLEVLPENDRLYGYLGNALFKLDSFESALEAFQKRKEYSIFDGPINDHDIGITKIKLGDFEGGIADLQQAALRNQNYYLQLSTAYEMKGDLVKSEEYLTKYWMKWKDNPSGIRDFSALEKSLRNLRKRIKDGEN